jgi:hypothetical protein
MPELYYGTQPASQVMQNAQMAQQAYQFQQQQSLQERLAQNRLWEIANQNYGQQELARINNPAEMERLQASLASQQRIAQGNNTTQQYGYDQQLRAAMEQANANRYGSELGYQGTLAQTDANRYASQLGLQGQLAGYGTQQNIAGMNNQSALQQAMLQSQTQMGLGNLQSQTALQQTQMPLQASQYKFDAVMPLIAGALGGSYTPQQQYQQMYAPQQYGQQYAQQQPQMPQQPAGGVLPQGMTMDQWNSAAQQQQPQPQMTPTMGATPSGGTTTPGTGIGGLLGGSFSTGSSSAPSYSPLISSQQQDQMLNSAMAGNAQTAASSMNRARQSLGARGWAPTSPALGAMQQRTDFNRMNADTTARTQIPLQVAQANAQYGLQQGQQGLDWYKARTGSIAPLIGALGSLV